MFNNRPPADRADDPDQEGREQIRWLRSLGDREALFQFMDGERQTERGLEAAEALVMLGDVRGLDHLIASLRSADSSLRHEAARILRELNHPRGLRALRHLRDEPGSPVVAVIGSKLDVPREKLHEELEALGTDELVGLWHEKDRSKMPGPTLEVLSEILTERLGKLPPNDDDTGGLPGDQIDDDVDPQVQDLWIQRDTAALMRMFEDTSDVRLQLEVAEALADLGDDDALDVLIEALDDPDRQINETAAEMLDWLDLPRGKQALEDRGIEFEPGAGDLFSPPEPGPVQSAASASSSRVDPWAAGTPVPQVARPQPPQAARPLGVPGPGQQLESTTSSAGVVLIGAVGGLIGFILFRFGLDVLGLQPLPAELGGWIQGSAIYYLGASVLAGAVSGTVGSRVAQAIGRRVGWEPAEGDLLPVLGALFEGATSAVVLNIFLTYFLRP